MVWLGFPTSWLNIDDLGNIFPAEDMMITANSLCKTKVMKQSAKFAEFDVFVRSASENTFQNFSVLARPFYSKLTKLYGSAKE